MTATFKHSGVNFMPVIKHQDGKRETLWGEPLVTKAKAIKYAQMVINARRRDQ